eukprot:CAMPEP_0194498760 /NCGR_PEP_ID=MMETSP0253-20130528/15287_1 /TAXON_ID=2966 /ORGANISM="Noctiluca scintillans" /LENGTH=295 /DNA_ID=CAMNT_0039340447 /DNA_START=82 /DNA_END=970 /DNA_ORIENTATION=+
MARMAGLWSCCATVDEVELHNDNVLIDEQHGVSKSVIAQKPASELSAASGAQGSGETAPTYCDDQLHSVQGSDQQLGPGEFAIDISKDGDGAGLEIESINGMLLVAKLKKGPMKAWNATHSYDPHSMVKAGDRIVVVNGAQGDSTVLIDELKKDVRLRMILRHAKEFKVNVCKGGKDLGMCVVGGNVKLDMLKISALKEGVIEDWNKLHREQEVMTGDRIICVNGIGADPQAMLQELKTNSVLDMTASARTRPSALLHGTVKAYAEGGAQWVPFHVLRRGRHGPHEDLRVAGDFF